MKRDKGNTCAGGERDKREGSCSSLLKKKEGHTIPDIGRERRKKKALTQKEKKK